MPTNQLELLGETRPAHEHVSDSHRLRLMMTGDLPKALDGVRDILTAALAGELPTRSQKWRRRDEDSRESGTFEQDANTRIVAIACKYLHLLRRHDAGEALPSDLDAGRVIVAELQRWAGELRPVLAAKSAYDAALAVYESAAPERIAPTVADARNHYQDRRAA